MFTETKESTKKERSTNEMLVFACTHYVSGWKTEYTRYQNVILAFALQRMLLKFRSIYQCLFTTVFCLLCGLYCVLWQQTCTWLLLSSSDINKNLFRRRLFCWEAIRSFWFQVHFLVVKSTGLDIYSVILCAWQWRSYYLHFYDFSFCKYLVE